MPRVSVIISAYNAEKYIRETVESMLNQTYRDIEVIVGNDASSDSTMDILCSIKDSRLKILDRAENRGSYYTLNQCIEAASGEYIANIDSDDVAYNNRISIQAAFMDENPQVSMCGSDYNTIYDNNSTKPSGIPHPTPLQKRFSIPFGNFCLPHSSFMMRADILHDHNIRYGDFRYAGDYDIQWKLLKYGEIAVIPQTLIAYRIHKGQNTSTYKRDLIWNEMDSIADHIMCELEIPDGVKQGLQIGIRRQISDDEQMKQYVDAFEEYRRLFGLSNYDSLGEALFCQYINQTVLGFQRASLKVLHAIIKEGHRYYPLNNGNSFRYVVNCILSRNNKFVKYKDGERERE